jgi:hypothetical protein
VNVTGTGSNIALTDGGGETDFGNEIIGNVTLGSDVGNVSFTNTETTVISGVSAGGVFNLNVTDLNQSGGDAQLLLAGTVTASGTGTSLLHAAGDIAYQAGNPEITAAALDLITDDGGIGTGTFLETTANSLSATTGATGSIHISNNGAFVIGISGVGGLNIGTGGGYIGAKGDNGTITQLSGTDGAIVGHDLQFGAGVGYTLDNANNNVTGALTLYAPAGSSVSFTNNGNTMLGGAADGLFDTTTVGGNLTLTVLNGSLSQSDAIYLTNLTVNASGNVTLTDTSNDLTGTFSAITPGNVSFINTGDITLGDVNAGPDGDGVDTAGIISITSQNGGIDDTGAVVGSSVTLQANGDITQTGALDGGAFSATSTTGNITLLDDNDFAGTVTLSAVNGTASFGNNDNTTLGTINVLGDVTVLSAGDLTVTSSIDRASGSNVTLVAGWDGTTTAPSSLQSNGTYGRNGAGDVYIGSNGASTGLVSVGSQSGHTVVEGHAINVNATNGSQIGYNGGAGGGDITVLATGDVTVAGTSGHPAQIGNGGLTGNISGNITGNILINTTGNIQVASASGTTWLGNVAKSGFIESGNLTVIAAGGSLTGPDLGADLGTTANTGGDVFIGWTSGSNVGGLTYNSPHAFTWAASGELDVTGDIQNAGSGAINLIGGWDGHTTALANLTNAAVYGQGGDVVIGVSCGTGNVHVGGGVVTVEGSDVTLNTQGGIVQLGYAQDTGGGNIVINANGALTLGNATNATGIAQIGNGLTLGHKSATGNITIDAGSVVIDNGYSYFDSTTCATVNATVDTWVAGNDANIIAETGGIGGAGAPLVVALNTIAVPHAGPNDGYGADVYISSPGGGISIGNNGNGLVTNGGNLVLTAAGDITQTSSIISNVTNISTTVGNITLTSGGNFIGEVALAAPGNVVLYDGSGFGFSTDLTVDSAAVGGNLTLLTTGELDVIGDAQAGGSVLAVAGWSGNLNVVTAAALAAATDYGANDSGIIIGDLEATDGASLGGATGTTVFGDFVQLVSNVSTAQLGYNGATTGNINVTATHDVNLYADDGCGESGCEAFIGNTDFDETGAVGGNITIAAGGSVSLSADPGCEDFAAAWIGNEGSVATIGGVIDITAAHSVLLSSAEGGYTQIGNNGFDGDGITVSGDVSVTANGHYGIRIGGDGSARIGNYVSGDDTTVGGDITVTANDGGIKLTGSGEYSLVQIGNEGVGGTIPITGGNVTVAADGGDVELRATADDAIVQIGNGGPDSANTDPTSGEVNVSASGDVQIKAFGEEAVAQIGNGGMEQGGPVSGNVTVDAGGDVSLYGKNSGLAQIGNLGIGSSVGGTINVTAAENVSLLGEQLGSTHIGNGGDNTDIAVNGDVSVTANGTSGVSLVIDCSGYVSQIGNYAFGDGAQIGGDIAVTANYGGVFMKSDAEAELVQIGNLGLPDFGTDGSDQSVGGNIVVTANGGDVKLRATDDLAFVQIGNSGLGTSGTIGGDITVVASHNVDVLADADGSRAQIGNGGYAHDGAVSGDISVNAAGNISISAIACATPDFALIGNGDPMTDPNNPLSSTGSVSGDINLLAGGALKFNSDGGEAWLGNIAGSDDGDIESGNVTVVANSENDADDASFGDMIVADLGTSNASGGNIFVGLTSSVGNIGGLQYGSPHALSIATTGNLSITGGIRNNGTGALNLIAGWDGTTFTPASLANTGVYGNNGGSVTIGGTGLAAVGSAQGVTKVAGANVTLSGALAAAQIGYTGSGSGNIIVRAVHDVVMTAGNCTTCYVQIGDGGALQTSLADSDNISVQATFGNITLTAGPGVRAYAQIGNGGDRSSGTYGGNITVTAGGALSLLGSTDYAQIGNGGWMAVGNASGNIVVNVASNISLTSPVDADKGYAQIGNGGEQANGTDSGDVSVTSNGTITLTAGNQGLYAQIGNGEGQSGFGGSSGNIIVNAAALTLTGAASASPTDNFVEIGNYANGAAASGNIAITVTGATTINTTDGGGHIAIGNYVQTGGSSSGSVSVITGDFIANNDDNDNTEQFVAHDLSGGAFTLGVTDVNAGMQIGGLDYNSANALTLLTAGSLTFVGDLQNAGTGNITIATGWNPSVAPANVASTQGAYGNNNGTLTIGGAAAGAGASVGSAGGTTRVLTDNLTVNAAHGTAQLGYRGAGNGAIAVSALGNVLVETNTIADAQIGNGGMNVTGAVGGDITINAGNNITVEAQSISLPQIGNLGHAGASVGGNVSLTAGGTVFVGGLNAFVGDVVANGSNIVGSLNGAVNITAAALTSEASPGLDGNSPNGVTGNSANIVLTGAGNSVGSSGAFNELQITVNDLAIHTNNGDAYISSPTHGLSIGVGDNGINLGSGNLSLVANGDIIQANAPTVSLNALNITSTNGSVLLENTGDKIRQAAITTSGDGELSSSEDLTITSASVGGNLQLNVQGALDQTGAISTNELFVAAPTAALNNSANAFDEVWLNTFGDVSLVDSESLKVDVALVGGNLTLISGGSITQGGNISANGLVISASNGSIALTNASNGFDNASLTASGDASLTDADNLTITGANVGGTLTLTGGDSIGQSGAIVADTLAASTSNGDISLTNSGNAFTNAALLATGNATLADAGDLTIIGVDVGGSLGLTSGGSINALGPIIASGVTATASNGDITLTDAGNTFTTAALTASGNASLTDTGSLTITGATVGGALALNGSSIGQSGAISANSLAATASNGDIVLTNAGNAIANAALTASGNASLYDASDLTLNGAATGGDLTLLTKGNLTFATSTQSNNGSILAVAGWDGTTTGAAAATGSAYGNHGGSITVGGSGASGGVAVGSKTGTTTLATNNLLLSAIDGYAQVGYQGGGSGAILVNATGNVTLNGGTGTAYFAQIGDGGYRVSGNNSDVVSVLANGNVSLNAGSGQEAYAQIGNGGAESNSNSNGYTDTGAVTIHGKTVALNAGSGNASYAQIGDGGYKSGQSLNGVATVGGNVEIDAVSAVTLTGNAVDAYAQVGNGGDFINMGGANGSSGTTSGDILVAVSSPVKAGNAVTATAGSGADSYAQIGNGGNGENTPATGATVSFNVSGNLTVNDLALTGSNTGADGYAQIGNGDGAGTGTGNISGDITISKGTQFILKPGSAPGTSTGIQNNTGSGSVSGSVSGYTGTGTTTTPTSDPTSAGSVANIIQNSNTPTTYIYTEVVVPPQYNNLATEITGGTAPGEQSPLEKLAGNDEDDVPSDGVAHSVSDSLDGGKTRTTTRTIIPGVLEEIVTLTPRNPHGIPPADEDYSSWGNEAFWRW